jgi:hypothetical protein
MSAFVVTIRSATGAFEYTAIAPTSFDAWDAAASANSDNAPCGITVKPVAAK